MSEKVQHVNPTLRVILLSLVSFALAAIRVAGHKSEIFQAIAHLWVGGLFGAGFIGRDRLILALAVVLSLVELACFLR